MGELREALRLQQMQRTDSALEQLVAQLRLASQQHDECPICYEELFTQRCVVFTQVEHVAPYVHHVIVGHFSRHLLTQAT